MPTIQTVLANTATQDWEIEHVDVKSAYLNAPLNEEIYMRPPRNVLKLGQDRKVLRLQKGLYGLKQAGCSWYMQMLKVFMNEMDFKWSAIDYSVFYWRTSEEHTIVAIATDDIAVTSKQRMDIECFKSKIKEFWDMTNRSQTNKVVSQFWNQ